MGHREVGRRAGCGDERPSFGVQIRPELDAYLIRAVGQGEHLVNYLLDCRLNPANRVLEGLSRKMGPVPRLRNNR